MKSRLLMAALSFVISQIDAEDAKGWIDDLLDKVEDKYADNFALMRGIGVVRQVFSIPDGDD